VIGTSLGSQSAVMQPDDVPVSPVGVAQLRARPTQPGATAQETMHAIRRPLRDADRQRARPSSCLRKRPMPLNESPADHGVSLTRSAPISALTFDCSPHAHGFIAATSMKLAGNDSEPRARLIVTTWPPAVGAAPPGHASRTRAARRGTARPDGPARSPRAWASCPRPPALRGRWCGAAPEKVERAAAGCRTAVDRRPSRCE